MPIQKIHIALSNINGTKRTCIYVPTNIVYIYIICILLLQQNKTLICTSLLTYLSIFQLNMHIIKYISTCKPRYILCVNVYIKVHKNISKNLINTQANSLHTIQREIGMVKKESASHEVKDE